MLYRVEGEFSNLENQTIYAVFENNNTADVDTVVCEEPGRFRLEKKTGDYDRVTLLWENKSYWITAFLEKGQTVRLSGDALYPALVEVKGGKLNGQLTEIRKSQAPLWREQADLTRSIESPDANAIDKSDLMARLANINLQLDETTMTYISEHPENEASLVLIQFFYMNPEHIRYLDKALSQVSTSLRSHSLYKELEAYSVRSKRAMPGAEAPDFSVKNIHGKTLSLDSIGGKYTVLIFTAPWADVYTSKREMLESFARHFPKEEVEIVVVSLDTDANQVRDILSDSTVKWNLVTDSAGQATSLLDLYNVSSLPRCFLIDQQHKIQLKTDSGPDMERELEKILK